MMGEFPSRSVDTELPLQGAWVPVLAGELRSYKPYGRAKNKSL